MPTIVGVKLRFAPKVLSFDPADTQPEQGDIVIVETERGREIGEVLEAPHDVAASDLVAPLKPVLRVADASDLEHAEELERLEREAMPGFRQLVNEHKLDMKPIAVEYLFDSSKIIFYFSAEERVDFRDLVRDLASKFKSRIDMRQVGVRDEARMVGGLGHCGEQLCCVRFGGEFQPVSIRMAKEQDLPLNPLKISGLCGRLMCCLRYEYDAYKDFKSRAPKRGAMIDTPLGEGKVRELNTPRETVTMWVSEAGQSLTVPLSAMECGSGKGCPCKVKAEALEEAGVSLPAPVVTPVPREKPERTAEKEQGSRSNGSRRGRGKPKPRSEEAAGAASKKGDAPKAKEAKGESQSAQQAKPKAAAPARRRRRRRSTGGGSTENGQ